MKTIQVSAFPEDRPDEITNKFKSKKEKTGEALLKKFLSSEGPYKFAKMAEEIREKSEEYCQDHYGMSSEQIWQVCSAIFSEFTFWRMTIEEFLRKIKKEPFFSLEAFTAKKKEEKLKPVKQVGKGRKKSSDAEDV